MGIEIRVWVFLLQRLYHSTFTTASASQYHHLARLGVCITVVLLLRLHHSIFTTASPSQYFYYSVCSTVSSPGRPGGVSRNSRARLSLSTENRRPVIHTPLIRYSLNLALCLLPTEKPAPPLFLCMLCLTTIAL